jgi:hypothetical protein
LALVALVPAAVTNLYQVMDMTEPIHRLLPTHQLLVVAVALVVTM